MTKQRLLCLTALVILSVFALAVLWEYVMEDFVEGLLQSGHVQKTGSARWIHIISITVFALLSLTIPVLVAVRAIASKESEVEELARTKALLNTVVESFSDGFVFFDADDRFLFCNTAYRNSHPKVSEIQVPGAKFESIVRRLTEVGFYGFSPEEKEKWIKDRLEYHRTGEPFEYRMENGRWFETNQFRTGEGGTALVRTDVTERKKAELTIKESEQQLRLITDNIPVLIAHFDMQHRYRFANKVAEQWYGRPITDILGKSAEEILDATAYEKYKPRFEAVSVGETLNFDEVINYPDGKTRFVTANYVPDIAESGEIQGFFCMIVDITERKQAEVALQEKEALYTTILDNTPNPINLKDVSGRYLFVNKVFADRRGMNADELLGKTAKEIWPEDAANDIEAHDNQVLETGEVITSEIVSDGADGNLRTYLGAKFPVFNADGHAIAIGAVHTDITDSKAAEEVLRQSEANISTILEMAPEAVISVSDDRRIVFFNRSAEDIFGYSAKELVGKSMDVLIPQWARAGHASRVRNFTKSSTNSQLMTERGEITGLRKDGTEFPAEASISRHTLAGEARFTVMLRDTSARKQREEETHQLQAQLEQSRKMEAMGTLAGGIAHDINNALVPIVGLSELTADSLEANSPAAKNLARITDSATRIGNLTQRILMFSRQDEAQDHPIDIHSSILETLQFLRPAIPSSIVIFDNLNPDTGKILADETQLQQIIMNLLTNAVHALGGGLGRIKITLDQVDIAAAKAAQLEIRPGGYVWLRIADNGPGIPLEVLHRIFDPFFTTKPVGEGTGLGLSLVHGIVTAHGGMITATNRKSSGAAFDLYWPLLGQEG